MGRGAVALTGCRFGHADEFAQTVKWIIECAYVNGETIRLTGGARLPGRL
jgi:3-hydroxyacyl-CoA dehydrogenase/3-hydroxy-2-methylbutyryl-CoA dehydrogenase